MQISRKKRCLLISLIVILLLAVTVVSFLFVRQDITYRIRITAKAVFAESFSPAVSDCTTMQMTLAELQNDARVTFDQSMLLINEDHLLSNSFQAHAETYQNTDVIMNVCMHDAYQALSEHVSRIFGEKLYIRSAYRTAEEQLKEIAKNTDSATQVGASEHQAGLALDVYVPYYAGKAFLKTEVGRYVNSNCQEFGFIVRYPIYGEDITGIPYEPWHLRYVGTPHAEISASHCITLEEYIDCFEIDTLYTYQSFILSRQKGDTFTVPNDFDSLVISQDHTGSYFLTFQCN